MKGVVLAAGEGTRLRPLTEDRPKPLVEVGGTSLLTRCFETLLDLGIREAVVVVGYEAEAITERYGDDFREIDITYAHQAERDGLAHAVLAAATHVDSPFFVLNGDNVYAADLSPAVERHGATDADVVFPVREITAEAARGVAVCELDGGTVAGLVEKPDDPPSSLAPAGCYVLPPAVFPACRIVRPSERGEYELADAIDLLIHAGYRVETVPFDGRKVNVNTERDVRRAERLLAGEE